MAKILQARMLMPKIETIFEKNTDLKNVMFAKKIAKDREVDIKNRDHRDLRLRKFSVCHLITASNFPFLYTNRNILVNTVIGLKFIHIA